jgi:tetratricopeptide (TPR) repeat protein
VPPATALAMTRAFVDAFPQSVLLSGMREELLLVGTTASSIEIDPERLARTFAAAPRVLADLQRIDFGTVKEIAGSFVGSSAALARATGVSPAASDDRPLQEYGVRSAMSAGANGVPAALFDLPSAHTWCPRCFTTPGGPGDDAVTPAAAGLDTYLALLDEAYHAPPDAARLHATGGKILGSAYLGATLPDTAGVHNIIGVTLLEDKRYEEAAAEFRASLKRREDSADANRNLGTALAALGNREEALTYLRRAVQLAPDNQYARRELEALLR